MVPTERRHFGGAWVAWPGPKIRVRDTGGQPFHLAHHASTTSTKAAGGCWLGITPLRPRCDASVREVSWSSRRMVKISAPALTRAAQIPSERLSVTRRLRPVASPVTASGPGGQRTFAQNVLLMPVSLRPLSQRTAFGRTFYANFRWPHGPQPRAGSCDSDAGPTVTVTVDDHASESDDVTVTPPNLNLTGY